MRKRTGITILAAALTTLVLIAGCSSHKALWGDADNGFILRYHQKKGSVNQYELKSAGNTIMQVMDQEIEMVLDATAKIIHKIDDVVDEKVTHSFMFDELNVYINSSMGDMSPPVKEFIKKPLIVKTNTNGKNIKFQNIKDYPLSEGGSGMEQMFFGLLIDFPDNPVKINDTWTSNQHFDLDRKGNEMQISAGNEYVLKGVEERMGFNCVVIDVKTRLTVQGSTTVQGMPADITGSGRTSSTVYFAFEKGFIVEVNLDSPMSINMSAGGMDISGSLDEKTTIKLIK